MKSVRNMAPAIVTLNNTGADVGRRITSILGAGQVHGYVERVSDPDVPFLMVQEHLRDLFSADYTIIAIMSSGIVIRALGGLVQRKQSEAPVLCVSEDGLNVVPLLGGHRGANGII